MARNTPITKKRSNSCGQKHNAMWKTIAFVLAVAGVLSMVVTEVLRSIIHARRKSKDGFGGTQDIAMWGTITCGFLLIAAAVSGIIAFVQ